MCIVIRTPQRNKIDFCTGKLLIRNCFEHYCRNARVPYHLYSAGWLDGWMDSKILRLCAICSSRCEWFEND